MLIPLGILAASGSAPTGDYELISTTVISGTSTAAVTFDVSSFASTYRHFQIRSVERHSNAVTEGRGLLTINGSGGTRAHYLIGTGTSVLSIDDASSGSGVPLYSIGASGATGNFTSRVTDILDAYSTTKNKTIRSLLGFADSSLSRVGLHSGFWASTASIASITFTSQANWVAGSRFSIYGIRG
jgi:hypothetical protein